MGGKRMITALALLATMQGGSASAADPVQESCELAAALAGGTDRIIEQFQSMAALWGESERAKLDPVFRPELSKFNFASGNVYIVADFDPFMREYLVVSGDKSHAAAIFFRLIFTEGPDGYMFRNVDFNTDYSEIMKTNLAQPPEEVDCGA